MMVIKEKVIVIMDASSGIGEATSKWFAEKEAIASAVVFAIDIPDRMAISDMIVRPTTQPV